jgi:hypothetical protein
VSAKCSRSNYDRVCADLFAAVAAGGALRDLPSLAGSIRAEDSFITVFNEEWCVGADGPSRGDCRLDTTGSILVGRYLFIAGTTELAGVWLPYRDLKGGLQFASFIKTHLEDRIALEFSGRVDVLRKRMLSLGARAYTGETAADLAVVVNPLPKVPVLCLFWDKDEEFPASFQFLFDASAPAYLDLESLAVALQYIYSRITRARAEET